MFSGSCSPQLTSVQKLHQQEDRTTLRISAYNQMSPQLHIFPNSSYLLLQQESREAVIEESTDIECLFLRLEES